MFGIIRVSKTDDFRNGSGSSDPNRHKILKITVSYHMELGGVFKMAPQPPSPRPILRTWKTVAARAKIAAFGGLPSISNPLRPASLCFVLCARTAWC